MIFHKKELTKDTFLHSVSVANDFVWKRVMKEHIPCMSCNHYKSSHVHPFGVEMCVPKAWWKLMHLISLCSTVSATSVLWQTPDSSWCCQVQPLRHWTMQYHPFGIVYQSCWSTSQLCSWIFGHSFCPLFSASSLFSWGIAPGCFMARFLAFWQEWCTAQKNLFFSHAT